jgi:hypothetical protein
MIFETLNTLMAVPAVIPDPTPVQPPGMEPVSLLVNWVSWAAIVISVIGFLASAGYLAISSFQGREIQGVKGLAIAIIACVLVAATGTIIQVFI